MPEPVTTLDKRFSEPGAELTNWATTRQALESAEVSWLATVRADGRPHATPLVTVWLDHAIHFCTGPEEQKAVNLRRNRHVVLITGCNDWRGGLDVIVEGDAELVTDEDRLRRLAAAWATKWDGRWRYEVRDGSFVNPGHGAVLVFEVRPAKVLSFGKDAFSQTRHTF
jgi:nitroimidazol reductase NimA-like FMN-containing flavoprotein (pyridoxamine 5'-phosphate oxidase superfamily)